MFVESPAHGGFQNHLVPDVQRAWDRVFVHCLNTVNKTEADKLKGAVRVFLSQCPGWA